MAEEKFSVYDEETIMKVIKNMSTEELEEAVALIDKRIEELEQAEKD